MAHRSYRVYNGATAALTAGLARVATGTTIKTMIQVLPTANMSVVGWGYAFDTTPTGFILVELLTTGTVAATVTAFAAGDVVKYNYSDSVAAPLTLSTSGSGFTSTAEGSITATRLLDYNDELAQSFKIQFPLDREPGVIANDVLRLRVTSSNTLQMTCFIDLEGP